MQNATPQELYDENQLRKKYKLKELKDPKAPKRPALGGYMYYLVELRQNDPSFGTMPLMEQSKEASRRYKALSDQEKKVNGIQWEMNGNKEANIIYSHTWSKPKKPRKSIFKKRKSTMPRLRRNRHIIRIVIMVGLHI